MQADEGAHKAIPYPHFAPILTLELGDEIRSYIKNPSSKRNPYPHILAKNAVDYQLLLPINPAPVL